MGERAISAVAGRLNRLEQENRRLRRVGAAGLLVLSALVLTAQTPPAYVSRVVEAERFVVRDAKGTTRAAIGLAPDGSASLALYDRQGDSRAGLIVRPDGSPGVVFHQR